jgi:hypothetical protein
MHGVSVTVVNERGAMLFCETEGCNAPATGAWHSAGTGKSHLACDAHNPYAVRFASTVACNYTLGHCPGCQCPTT